MTKIDLESLKNQPKKTYELDLIKEDDNMGTLHCELEYYTGD